MRSSAKPFSVALQRDINNTFRIWRLNAGSTLAAYLALTVGIGATTAVFSVLSSLMLRPLPIADSSRVMRVMATDAAAQEARLTMPDSLDLKQRLTLASGFAFYRPAVGNLADQARPVMVRVLETDADLFKVMGLKVAQGKAFGAAADQPGRPCEALISWSLWQGHLGGRPVVGKTIPLNRQPCLIDGILPAHLDLPVEADIWTAANFDLADPSNGRRIRFWYGLARLKSGVTVAAFNSELAAVCKELSREHPNEDTGLKITATPLRDWISRGVKDSILILFVAVMVVLLMACANVANLLLARSSARLREISVRVAVGASRLMLFQQLITESLLLALLSCLSGLLLTAVVVNVLRNLPNLPIPRPESVVVDWRVVLFAIAIAAFTGLLFGSLPAIRVSMTSLTGVLSQAGGRVSETRRHQTVRKMLVGLETSMATVLLIASLLLIRSFAEISNLNPGFQTDHLLTAYLLLTIDRYGKDQTDTARLVNRVVDSLKNKPGIESAAAASSVPYQNVDPSAPAQVEGQPLAASMNDSPFVYITAISPSFRRTLNIPLLAGRDLGEHDNTSTSSSVLVNSSFAQLFFPDTSAVGKRVRLNPYANPEAPWMQIAGVIANTRQSGVESKVQPEIFIPLAAYPAAGVSLAIVIRTSDKPLPHLKDIQDAVSQADPEIPVFSARTMEQVESRRLGSRRFNTVLFSLLAIVALALACGGIFAVITYSVSQRTPEIGVRMACGASQRNIVLMIVRQALLPALLGIVAGLLAALFLNRYLASLLYGVKTTDLISYAGTVILLVACCTVAALLPARRAARIDPWRALRYE